MRYATSFLLLLCAVLPTQAESPDWAAFQNPKSIATDQPMFEALAALPPAEKAAAVQRLQGMLSSENIEIRRRTAVTLGRLGDMSGVPAMIRDMSARSGNDRGNAAVVLRILKDPRAIPVLRASLRDKEPYVRGIALAALGEMKATEAFADIAAHLYDKEREQNTCIPLLPCGSATYALGLLGDRKAIPLLVKALDDREVALPATQALTALTGERFGSDVDQWKKWWKASEGK